MPLNLSRKILTTLSYYDVMDYPMTSFEIWKHLFRSSAEKLESDQRKQGNIYFHDLTKALDGEELKKYIEEYRGFFFLKGRKNLVEQRIRKNKISERKYKILLKVVKILRMVPFVRMIAVTGKLSMKNADEKSDLDLLVVIESGKIFTGRTLVTLAVHLIGKRRYKDKIADRVCLNYFITTSSLEISLKDMFSSSEYYFMLPIFGFDTFKEFRDKNSWIKEYKVNYQENESSNSRLIKDNFLTRLFRKSGEKILQPHFIENALKSWQVPRIRKNPKTGQVGSMVTASDDELIFLPNPRGPKIYDRFKERMNSFH